MSGIGSNGKNNSSQATIVGMVVIGVVTVLSLLVAFQRLSANLAKAEDVVRVEASQAQLAKDHVKHCEKAQQMGTEMAKHDERIKVVERDLAELKKQVMYGARESKRAADAAETLLEMERSNRRHGG